MFARISKAGLFVLAVMMGALLALPATAAGHRGGHGWHRSGSISPYIDRRSGFRRDFNRGGGRFAAGDRFGSNRGWSGRNRFGPDQFVRNDFDRSPYGRRAHDNRLRRLSSTSGFVVRRGSGVTVVFSDRSDYDFTSNFAGSSDVYRANGGTYATGFGYGDDASRRVQSVAPRARVIDTARAGDPCSHEAGVCVIRP